MNSLKFCLFVIVLIIDGISHGYDQRQHEQDVKNELLKLLIPSEVPNVVEDPRVELKERNLIDTLQYFPSQDISNNFKNPSNNDRQDGQFANIPWLTFNEGNSRGANTGKNTYFITKVDDDNNQNEEFQQYDVKNHHHNDNNNNNNPHQLHMGGEQGFQHTKHGFYQGSGLHYHHVHGHYNEHNHGCFPPRRRPPPRPRPTTTTASSNSIDPRMSTVAGFMATQVPRIDVRGLI